MNPLKKLFEQKAIVLPVAHMTFEPPTDQLRTAEIELRNARYLAEYRSKREQRHYNSLEFSAPLYSDVYLNSERRRPITESEWWAIPEHLRKYVPIPKRHSDLSYDNPF